MLRSDICAVLPLPSECFSTFCKLAGPARMRRPIGVGLAMLSELIRRTLRD